MAVTPIPVSCYPASDPGFAALSVDELLASEADLIARIKLCYGTDRESFERDVLTLIRRYAACVHLLPATADNYFSKPGGLLRLGLETAFFSLQGTDAHIFSGRMSISSRRQLEPRWRHATFIAGLCCELHRLLSHVIVTDTEGEVWPAFLQPLEKWLLTRGAERYFLRWRPQAVEARGLGLFALPHVVPPTLMADLSEGNTVIVPHLLASISGIPIYREHNIVDELVRRSLALVIDRNLAASADRYGSPQYGSHLERYLVDALRRLTSGNSAWVPNREKSRLWFGQDGLFLVWPGAAEDVHQLLEADQLAGIPKAPETMLELLLAA
ncbi:MAG: TraI domain-containing protein, partial [Dechloromonas sp.]|nr:TraI domain-containing protein [Dechloromonas sp.]